MRIYQLLRVLCVAALVLAAGCATPTTPGGGPRDQQGPEIVSAEPSTGTTNFSGRTFTFHFSEFIQRNSLRPALTVEPDIGISYEIDWSRKSADIKFERALPDLTTVIITIGTELSDMNGNRMGQPVKIAVSTGPEIDEGELTGRVIDARTGKGNEGNIVLLYRQPVDLTGRANYAAETDTSGRFSFLYLRQGRYTAIWVDDRNRNKSWEPQRERAQPFQQEFVELAKGGTDTLGTVYIAGADTSAPALQGIGLFSSLRLRMRFSENIRLTDSTGISISDTLGNAYSGGYPLYIAPRDSFVLFAQSARTLSPDRSYRVEVNNVADRFGNVLRQAGMTITGSAQQDTTRQRVISTNVNEGIYPSEPVVITMAGPVAGNTIADSLKVVRGTDLIDPWQNLEITQNRIHIYPEEPQWKSGLSYEIRLWSPSRQQYRRYTPTFWFENDLGGIAVRIDTLEQAGQGPYRLRLNAGRRGTLVDTVFSGQVEINDLPPVPLQLVVFKDENGNGVWDHGTVQPFRAPEPFYIRNNIPVRKGFISDVTVHFDR